MGSPTLLQRTQSDVLNVVNRQTPCRSVQNTRILTTLIRQSLNAGASLSIPIVTKSQRQATP